MSNYISKESIDLQESEHQNGIAHMNLYGVESRNTPHLLGGVVDSTTLLPVHDAVFNVKELTQIQKRLYETKQEPFMMLSNLPNNNEYSPAASHFGYDIMETVGEAQVIGTGAEATDIPFVNENVDEKTSRAFEVQIGIRYDNKDIEKMTALRTGALGRGATYSVIDKRAAAARRAIMRVVERVLLLGDKKIGIEGLKNIIPSSATAEASIAGTSTNNAILINPLTVNTNKVKFADKTGQQILNDLIRLKRAMMRDGIFRGSTVFHSVATGTLLSKPYSEYIQDSPLAAFKRENPDITFVENTNFGASTFGTDTIVMIDNSFENLEVPIGRPYTLYPSDRDWTQVVRQLVAIRLGGIMPHYKGAFAFMQGHI